ncbi:FK506-binding protein 2B [Termitomyces sp. Mi166|nr:FK506-binding protein 2B [Termitomyces sp. Mi166\
MESGTGKRPGVGLDTLASRGVAISGTTLFPRVHAHSSVQTAMRLLYWFPLLFAAAAYAADAEPPTELVIETTYKPEGCTINAQKGDQIQVHYTGTLFGTGKKFDSSYDRSAPLGITLGIGQVIKGWDQGLLGMCVNEKRKLTIPPALGYGARGAGGVIPPGATLVFETEMVSINRQEEERDEL